MSDKLAAPWIAPEGMGTWVEWRFVVLLCSGEEKRGRLPGLPWVLQGQCMCPGQGLRVACTQVVDCFASCSRRLARGYDFVSWNGWDNDNTRGEIENAIFSCRLYSSSSCADQPLALLKENNNFNLNKMLYFTMRLILFLHNKLFSLKPDMNLTSDS